MRTPDARQILARLRPDAKPFSDDVAAFSNDPGIYAIFVVRATPELTKYGVQPGDLLYIGKTESSQLSRDLKTHFADGRTGSSTVRRTLGALLRQHLGLVPQPRSTTETTGKQFKNYKFDTVGEAALTRWMKSHLGLSFFSFDAGRKELEKLEGELIELACPVLNLAKNTANPHGAAISAARRECVKCAKNEAGSPPRVIVVRTRKPSPRAPRVGVATQTLHGAIADVLQSRPGRTGTAQEISDEIRKRHLYRKKSGAFAPPSQIMLRARKRPKLFEVLPLQRVRLR